MPERITNKTCVLCECVSLFVYVGGWVGAFVCVCVCVRVFVCVRVCMCVYVCVCLCVFVYSRTRPPVCVSVLLYTNTHNSRREAFFF